MEVTRLTSDNIEEIRSLYNSFETRAKEDYLFELPPLDFDSFKDNFSNNTSRFDLIKSFCFSVLNGLFLEN